MYQFVSKTADKKNLRICAGRCNQENVLMFTHQYLWDPDCSKMLRRETITQTQQLPAKCNQR
ncbi:hypothetical protein HA48_20060 [Pantoea wallisii]|uniref:Uncharacterized protein n=1 Tax=Pantoea wallisii TaxID=1076551 RepID=A0A1X1CWP7_9GAMM|nr:hypothetical protein HA48_20060 [Pantoea wallisii]